MGIGRPYRFAILKMHGVLLCNNCSIIIGYTEGRQQDRVHLCEKCKEESGMSDLELLLSAMRDRHLEARKEKDQVALSALGPLLGDIDTKEKGGKPLDLAGVYSIVRSHINGLQECISSTYHELNGEDEQIKILSDFLPSKMTEPQVWNEVRKYILEHDDLTPKDMGRIMKHFKDNFTGRYDGKQLADIVKEVLLE